ncbi:MAG: membrane protein insertion efficiency factor YidD [Candidatus Doudnabacteria bacterium]|nr:membrane protein insertion efficiency factor YidD [Candidatus Doudnabacteria bacterium]
MAKILKNLERIIVLPLLFLLWVYQKTISPDHGLPRVFFPYGYCKFYPSCSMYAREVLKNEGLRGTAKITRRLLACNPRSLGGVDLP